jgi:hypothetical protein
VTIDDSSLDGSKFAIIANGDAHVVAHHTTIAGKTTSTGSAVIDR